jgi:hypothetical protein
MIDSPLIDGSKKNELERIGEKWQEAEKANA